MASKAKSVTKTYTNDGSALRVYFWMDGGTLMAGAAIGYTDGSAESITAAVSAIGTLTPAERADLLALLGKINDAAAAALGLA